MHLINIPSLQDNYIWLLHNNKECVVFDPGEAKTVLKIIKKLKLNLKAILITHYHYDHIDGVCELLCNFVVPVYGPYKNKIENFFQPVTEEYNLILLENKFKIINLPGHTVNHIGYYIKPWLFCGDTLFSAGCGKIFEGTMQQMYNSIQKINQLPDDTLICCSHEYTLNNLEFAFNLMPEDVFIKNYLKKIKKLKIKCTLPTTLVLEKKINLFLRCDDFFLKKKLNCSFKSEPQFIFAELRKRKDKF